MFTSGESDQLPHVSPSHLPRNMLPSRPASKQRTNDAKRSVLRPATISNRAMQSTVSTLDRKNASCHQLHCIALQERATASEPPTFQLNLTTAFRHTAQYYRCLLLASEHDYGTYQVCAMPAPAVPCFAVRLTNMDHGNT